MPPDIRIDANVVVSQPSKSVVRLIQHPTLSLTRKDVHRWQQQAPPASKVPHTAPTVCHHQGCRASRNPANAL
ncbi:hypothetical protein K439DRAFT_1634024 [Ramaria rubella]|nr:hypothetical protein K439DRAFT_1634024 [Ramaria rubella]